MLPHFLPIRSTPEDHSDWKRKLPHLPDFGFLSETVDHPDHPDHPDHRWTNWDPTSPYDDDFANLSDALNNASSSVLSVVGVLSIEGTRRLQPQYWTLLLLVFPVLTAAGNGLVCASVFLERNLKTVTNYFIVSLAVADIMVALLVMPLAVYVEVNNSNWDLGDTLCDTWIACDVMSCTASILNLTAISVDRFTAVTRPIDYARHRKSRRVYALLAVPWLVSIAISSPIALGLNYNEKRAETPTLCTFYNSDFLIYSSMGSFYIPCLVMTGLYGRIYLAIRGRTRSAARRNHGQCAAAVAAAAKSAVSAKQSLRHLGLTQSSIVLEEPTGFSISEAVYHHHHHHHGRTVRFGVSDNSPSFADVSTVQTDKDPGSWRCRQGGVIVPTRTTLLKGDLDKQHPDSAPGVPYDALLGNRTTVSVSRGSNGAATAKRTDSSSVSGGGQSLESREENASAVVSSADDELPVSAEDDGCPRGGGGEGGQRWTTDPSCDRRSSNHLNVEQVARFKFRSRPSRSTTGIKRNRRAARRERKATKTLAIVLGVFLFCWMPFFTVNIINAICLRYEFGTLRESEDEEGKSICEIEGWLLSFLVWLGYINSFLNPVIYTIFNAEFRRAFRKILGKIF